jgi:hypothetical protein
MKSLRENYIHINWNQTWPVITTACFEKKTIESEAATRANFQISQIIAEAGKSFSDGILIKLCLSQSVEVLYTKKVELFKTISLPVKIVANRLKNIGSNLCSELIENTEKFECFFLALDKSTDVSDTLQLLLFI